MLVIPGIEIVAVGIDRAWPPFFSRTMALAVSNCRTLSEAAAAAFSPPAATVMKSPSFTIPVAEALTSMLLSTLTAAVLPWALRAAIDASMKSLMLTEVLSSWVGDSTPTEAGMLSPNAWRVTFPLTRPL